MASATEQKEVSYTLLLSEEEAQILKHYLQNSMFGATTRGNDFLEEPPELTKTRESIFAALDTAGVL